MEFKHTSVLLEETIENLNIKPDGIYVDGTLGGAGHAQRVCEKLSQAGRFIGIDQDEAAISAAGERLAGFGPIVSVVRDNYSNIGHVLDRLQIKQVDGLLLDLGVSSYQLDEGERGFSYHEDAPLDMRMDQRQEKTAGYVVNHYDEQSLFRIIRNYGEESFAKNIAKHIVQAREKGPISTTFELTEVIKAAIPMRVRKMTGHPSKKTFQAIRIEINRELEVLNDTLEEMIDRLKPTGRICVITFHSLEDRIVKNIFRQCENPCTCPPNFPICVCGLKPKGKVLTRKPLSPSEEELEQNSRSRSAKLRVFEKA